jgi:hypothetical protein
LSALNHASSNPQHLCADAGFKGKNAKEAVSVTNYRPQIQTSGVCRPLDGYEVIVADFNL